MPIDPHPPARSGVRPGDRARQPRQRRDPLRLGRREGVVTGRRTVLPTSVVYFFSPAEDEWYPAGIVPSSNGLASGNVREEAVLHGLYEVVERDSVSREAGPARVLDLTSVAWPGVKALTEAVRTAGASLSVTHIPSRFGVPCFAARIWSADFAITNIGFGAHLAADVAISRAITEAAQSRLTAIAGSRDDIGAIYAQVQHGVDAGSSTTDDRRYRNSRRSTRSSA